MVWLMNGGERVARFAALNPGFAYELRREPADVRLLLLAFYDFRRLLSYKSAAARSAWRSLPEFWRSRYVAFMAEVTGAVESGLGSAMTDVDLAWRIGRLFNVTIALQPMAMVS